MGSHTEWLGVISAERFSVACYKLCEWTKREHEWHASIPSPSIHEWDGEWLRVKHQPLQSESSVRALADACNPPTPTPGPDFWTRYRTLILIVLGCLVLLGLLVCLGVSYYCGHRSGGVKKIVVMQYFFPSDGCDGACELSIGEKKEEREGSIRTDSGLSVDCEGSYSTHEGGP